MMGTSLGASDFGDTWDLSMSTVPEIVPEVAKENINSNYQSLFNEFKPLSDNFSFFGLPNYVKNLIFKYKGIDQLYDWQIDCLNLPAVNERKNLLYSLPTSGGKTLVAEILMLKELLVRKKNVLFVLPYVALAQEKVRSLSSFGLDLEFYVEEYVGGKGKYPPTKHFKKRSVYVCTTEKAAGLIESLLDANRLDEIGMLVVDEIHLIGESRGPTLEMMLTKLMFVSKNVHIIAMSATVGNLTELGNFLNAFVYTKDFRPVELIEYVKCLNKVYRIVRSGNGTCELVFDRNLNFNYSEEMRRLDPGLLGGLTREVIPDNSCLVFCPTKKQCGNFALLICQAVDKNLKEFRKPEKMSLLRALAEEGQGIVCPILKKTIPHGVAYHHSGLTNAERKLLEEAFLGGALSCICCTSTLAAGVNLPAKRVIIFSPYVGRDFLKLSTYKQMSGRAGRMGLTSVGESYVVCQETDLARVLDLLKSDMDRCESNMNTNSFLSLTTCAIGLKIASTKSSLIDLYNVTLHHLQNISSKNPISAEEIIDKSLEKLTSMKAIVKSENGEYVLTQIAQAAMAGNVDITDAQTVYDELMVAVEGGLILSSYLHLFYLITPYSAVEEIPISRDVVISVYSSLSPVEKKIADRIGITEVCLIQYSKRGKITVISESIWNRFLRSLIIFNLWNKKSIWEVSKKFEVARGTIHNFLLRTAAFASSVQRFTEALKMEELEYFPALLMKIIPRLSYCCTAELLQLMQLPAVKIGRATQLYKAGYRTLKDIVNADPLKLVSSIDHLPRRVAYEIVAAAKLLLLQEAETLQEEAENLKAELMEKNMDITFTDFDELSYFQLSTPLAKK